MHSRWMPVLFLVCALLLDGLWIHRIVRLDQSFGTTLPNLAGAVLMLAAAVLSHRQARRRRPPRS